MTNISDNDKIKIIQFLDSLERYALGDIKEVRKHGLPIAAFILCVCFIDQLSGFIYNENTSGERNTSDRFTKFVDEYLNSVSKKKYDKNELLKVLRHKLVHNYSVTDRKVPVDKQINYALEYSNINTHLHRQGKTVYINIDGFITDIENAFALYKKRLSEEQKLVQNAIIHFDIYGILIQHESKLDM